MNDNGFKEYIENRTVADIMDDYSEQHSEWETLLVTDQEGVKRFRHQNGRDFFCEQYKPVDEDYAVDEKIANILSGKTIEQQMEFYYVTESYSLYSTAYGEITGENLRESSVKLCEYEGVLRLLLKGDILIGAKIKAWWGDGILLPDECVCTYYASDNEGSGTKDREDYAYLIFTDIRE
ncbi:MAG: hypothetical protein LUI10_14325 [Lachnospiraceae bacterium]|nr:hypothetical protein [Lachnospiraceae bacterium]